MMDFFGFEHCWKCLGQYEHTARQNTSPMPNSFFKHFNSEMLRVVSLISNETKERGSEWLEWSKCSVSKMNGLVFGSAGYKNVMYEGKILSCYVWCNCAIHTGLIEQQCETRSPTDDFTTSCFPSVLPHVCLPLSPVISTLCCCLSVIPPSEKHFRVLITDWNKKKKKK